MATKKSVAGDIIGQVYSGGGGNTAQSVILTSTASTISAGPNQVIAIIKVTPNSTVKYVAISREFLQTQLDNKKAGTATGLQLALADKYASISLSNIANEAKLTALGITPWKDDPSTAHTDFSVTATCQSKLGYDKYNHGTEITGFDYSDTTEADTAQATADAEADSKAKRQKTYMIIIGVILALILIFGFATDWKFSFKKEETQEHDGKHDKDKKDKKD